MREIKFRGKINGHWQYATPDRDVDEWEWFWALVDLETVGQYIGSKDKNGKEIYEGDIVNCKSFVANTEWIERIVDIRFLDRVTTQKYDREVIGNIYEHPELMEENNESI